MRQSGIILTVIAALLFALPGRVSAAETVDQAAIEQIVRDYLLKNPEVIRDALAELDRREKAAAVAQQRDAIAAQHAALTSGAEKTVVGNPDGDVTLVEFFDYNCGFCKRAHSDMKDLLASDPNLRVVYKEWPFLSKESLDAAKVSLAVARQGRYEEFHNALLLGRGTADEARAMEIAEAMGYDMDRIKAEKETPEILSILETNMKLADSIGVTGTPAYVVGDQLILGAQGFATLQQAVADVRQYGCQSC